MKIFKLNFILGALCLAATLPATAKVDASLFKKVLGDLRSRTQTQCNHDLFSDFIHSGQVRITIVYGYNDQRPYINVLDSIERATLQEGLTTPCSSNLDRLCGFTGDADQMLTKSVSINGARVDLNIRLLSSSVSQNDDWNRTTGATRQASQSNTTRSSFVQALQQSDVVFYVGHARSGGGPDFAPPRLNSNNQVDLASYRTEKAGIGVLMDGLRTTRNLKALGLFACNSAKLFETGLTETRRDISYFLAGDISTPTVMNSTMWAALDGILGKTCDSDLIKALTKVNTPSNEAHFKFIRNRP